MKYFPRRLFVAVAVLIFGMTSADAQDHPSWPPALPGAKNGAVTIASPSFLEVPESVSALRREAGATKFVMAKTPPIVRLALHRELGPNAVSRRLWSSWGDIALARDGSVYCGIGDHGNAVGGDARCFVYRWSPKSKTLKKVVDMNQVIPPGNGQPAWSKIHAKIDEGNDGGIYFCCTLNDGNRAKRADYKWNKQLPGGQLYRYDPKSGTTRVFANLPPRRCTATSILDRKRDIWWCNLEAGEGNALWGLNMKTGKPVLQTPDGTVAFNRNFALLKSGRILFNGESSLQTLDPATGKIASRKSTFSPSQGMRCSTRESSDGYIYGVTHRTNQLFRYHVARDELKLLGPNWLSGSYTTVCLLSPDEKYLYYLPGAHGKAWRSGTPVIQYSIATGVQKVLAFLAPTLESRCRFVPGGTYGIKLSRDGSTLYVNFNGHAADAIRPKKMKPIGFGLCGFAEIEIPESER